MSPRFWRWFALLNAGVSIVCSVVAEFTGWVDSNAYISRLSELAWILTALAWYAATRVEVNQDKDASVQEVLDYLKARDDGK